MARYIALGLAMFVGALTSIQSAINTQLGRHVGGVTAALISFSVGTASLGLVYIFSSENGLKNVTKVQPYLLIGGLFGAIFVFSMIKLVPQIGAGSTIAGVIAGQLILALVIDQFGWFGLKKVGIDFPRGMGAVLLILGVKLISK